MKNPKTLMVLLLMQLTMLTACGGSDGSNSTPSAQEAWDTSHSSVPAKKVAQDEEVDALCALAIKIKTGSEVVCNSSYVYNDSDTIDERAIAIADAINNTGTIGVAPQDPIPSSIMKGDVLFVYTPDGWKGGIAVKDCTMVNLMDGCEYTVPVDGKVYTGPVNSYFAGASVR